MYLEKDMIPDFRVNISESYVILPNMQYLIWFQAKTKCWWFAFSMLRVMQIPSYCSKYRKSCTPFINYIIKSLFLCKSQLSLLVHIYSNACHYLLHGYRFTGCVKLKGIIVIGGGGESHPNKMRLWVPNILFPVYLSLSQSLNSVSLLVCLE